MDQKSTEELLAEWADLLRTHSLMWQAREFYCVLRYPGHECGLWREYKVDDFDISDEMLRLFSKDIDARIATIEAALKERGISVQRPPLEAPNRQTDV
jgi:hypothetical protein